MNKILILLMILVSTDIYSQSNTEDIVYLKTGSIIRGRITEQTGPRVKIELLGGSIFVFQQTEIDSIRKENVLKRKLKEIDKNYFRRDHGFRNMTEFGMIYGATLTNSGTYDPYSSSAGDDFGISLHTVNGYQFFPYLYTGIGMGIDRFISYKQTFMPFYLRVASEFLKKKVTPYIFADVGYAYMWKRKNDQYTTYSNKGGLYLSAGGGVRIYTRSRASVILALAYKRTNSETQWLYTYDTGTQYDVKRTYQRAVFMLGVTF